MAFGVVYLLVLVVLGSCPVTALLKRRYVLFGLGLLLVVGGIACAPLSSRFGTLLGAVGFAVWIVAASRLAAPASRWARQLYGPQKLARARDRFAREATVPVSQMGVPAGRPAVPPPGEAPSPPAVQRTTASGPSRGPVPPHGPVSPPATGSLARPAIPIALTVAVVAVALGSGAAGIAVLAFVGSLPAGAALPLLWVVRAGWWRGRIVVTVSAVLLAVAFLVGAVVGRPTDTAWTAVVAGVVLVVAGLAALWIGPVGAYLRAADRS